INVAGAGTLRTRSSGARYATFTAGVNNGSSTFDGVIANTSGFTGNFTKTGSGTLTLTNTNTYTANTTITGGILSVASLAAIGPLSGAGWLAMQQGGAFQYTGTGTETRTGLLYWNSGSGAIDVT